ncbi:MULTISPECIES: recombinase family protein [unclassified Lysobacter]|uniref:recombinase family protein n=1 Tax=unclassified Lysobacter TaxID=2635362 RepID=UPI001BE7EBC2|nr:MULTISPECIES: recombinase family protein [unclassified Lysobacter]MBT2746204.1 recombinase family protein [Lysobacter sp. ISL-42]MBT2750749.1 recombinase family protein [Lysobacter sp. ISL-50]MBT2776104.1 recombinase family protein [Lysobacter sp. ISL-54]MBT2784610.1 recombinase family protein [Lysobacter sp. ISL-52]
MSTQSNLRVAVYCQTLGMSPDLITVQRVTISEALRDCCDLPPVIRVYADDGRCPNTQVREQFQTMLLDVDAGLIDCIAVMGRERLADRDEDYRTLKRFLDNRGVAVLLCEQAPAQFVRVP